MREKKMHFPILTNKNQGNTLCVHWSVSVHQHLPTCPPWRKYSSEPGQSWDSEPSDQQECGTLWFLPNYQPEKETVRHEMWLNYWSVYTVHIFSTLTASISTTCLSLSLTCHRRGGTVQAIDVMKPKDHHQRLIHTFPLTAESMYSMLYFYSMCWIN